MVGYTEVLQTIMAMAIFSIILLSANRMMHRNTFVQVEGELEREVIALAQDIIQESRTLEFDENSTGAVPPKEIPASFVDTTTLGTDTGESTRADFDDFDDFDGWETVHSNRHGNFSLKAEVYYVTKDTYQRSASKTTYKKIDVTVQNEFLTGSNDDVLRTYKFDFIRNYHAD